MTDYTKLKKPVKGKREIPEHLQTETDNPAHLGMKRNIRIGKREYRIPQEKTWGEDGIIKGTLWRITNSPVISSADDVYKVAGEYLMRSNELNKPITFTGFCSYLGVPRSTLLMRYNNDITIRNAIENVKLLVEDNLIDNALLGKYQHQIATLLLKNNHGYKDKIEVESSNLNVAVQGQTREQIIEAVEQARKLKAKDIIVTTHTEQSNSDAPMVSDTNEGEKGSPPQNFTSKSDPTENFSLKSGVEGDKE